MGFSISIWAQWLGLNLGLVLIESELKGCGVGWLHFYLNGLEAWIRSTIELGQKLWFKELSWVLY